MPAHDIETGLSDEDRSIHETVHRFAEHVLQPTGRTLDRLPDPADAIAPTSPLWEVFRAYNEGKRPRLQSDLSLNPTGVFLSAGAV